MPPHSIKQLVVKTEPVVLASLSISHYLSRRGVLPAPYISRQVQAHDAVMRFEHGRVDSKVSRGTRVGLDVDTPQSWVQVKGLQGSFLTQQLNLIHHFCSTIIPHLGVVLSQAFLARPWTIFLRCMGGGVRLLTTYTETNWSLLAQWL
ncbi:hypothetical protein EYF80_023433 [Liparis tanakae]|uniref:Uncharacterized protein n=1 Tax=Liparis tanakae TaxID=230148 RepID=A0A4Z2HN72_9TELE|nr:hypothetical protein EYF80_023433 [Liparis tanakae]